MKECRIYSKTDVIHQLLRGESNCIIEITLNRQIENGKGKILQIIDKEGTEQAG
jgi:hypothetical protein